MSHLKLTLNFGGKLSHSQLYHISFFHLFQSDTLYLIIYMVAPKLFCHQTDKSFISRALSRRGDYMFGSLCFYPCKF